MSGRDDQLRAALDEALRTTPAALVTEAGYGGEEYTSQPWHRHGTGPGGVGHDYLAGCALCGGDVGALLPALVAAVGRVRDAELAEARAQAAIDTQIMEKADREQDEIIAVGRWFRQQAEQTQAWGEQHRDRANRDRERLKTAEKELADERARVERVTAAADDLDARGTRTMDSSMCAAAGLIRRALGAQAAEPAGEVTR